VTGELYHRTRRSASIPVSLLRRGRVHDVIFYYLLRSSDLAREGLDHSGSHRFADHIYQGRPSGRGPFGRWLDARLLALPAVRAFRFRYTAVRDTLKAFLQERLAEGGAGDAGVAGNGGDAGDAAAGGAVEVLSVPCGIPREMADAAADVRARLGGRLDRVVFHGLDLDAVVLAEASEFAAARGLRGFRTHHGDALDRAAYPAAVDFITCTGLGEFLDDKTLARLYALQVEVLRPGGVLITSGMERRRGSDYLLRLAEIRTHYRSEAQLRRLFAGLPVREVATRQDAEGIQTIVTAWK
jgi:SAM-dependent methyltransferase